MTDVSAVVCTYSSQRWESLVRAVRSLQDQTLAPDEVVVVVDHEPGLLERAARAFPEAVVVANRGRRGLSDARNTGISAGVSEVVVFMDDDAEADRHLLERLVARLESGVVAVGGAVRPDWVNGRPAWFPVEFDWVVGCSYPGLPARVAPVRNLIGCNMAFRREALERVGGFRSDMGRVGTTPLGCEETDLCLRIGTRYGPDAVVYEPEAMVDHLVPRPRTRLRYFLQRCHGEGISKAVISAAHPGPALGTERAYVTGVLLPALGRYLRRAAGASPVGLGRAGAVLAGLAATTLGYLRGRATSSSPGPVGTGPAAGQDPS